MGITTMKTCRLISSIANKSFIMMRESVIDLVLIRQITSMYDKK